MLPSKNYGEKMPMSMHLRSENEKVQKAEKRDNN